MTSSIVTGSSPSAASTPAAVAAAPHAPSPGGAASRVSAVAPCTHARQRAGSAAITSSASWTSAAPSWMSAMRAPALRRAHAPGHRQHFAPELGGKPRGDQRAAPLRRLHHHHREGEPRDDAVALGKVMRQWRRARRELRDHSAPASRSAAPGADSPADRSRRRPSPSTAIVRPPASSAPRWAAVSMPRASPLTTVTPRAPSAAPSRSATSSPYGVARRDPTIATASASSATRRPRTYNVSGADGTAASCAGYRHERARDRRDLVDRVGRWMRVVAPRAAIAHREDIRMVLLIVESVYRTEEAGQESAPGQTDARPPSARAAPLPSELGQQCARLARGLRARISLHHALEALAGGGRVLEGPMTEPELQQRLRHLWALRVAVGQLLELDEGLAEVAAADSRPRRSSTASSTRADAAGTGPRAR